MPVDIAHLPTVHLIAACFTSYLSLVMCGVCMSWMEPLTTYYKSSDSEVLMTADDVSLVVSLVEAGAFFSPIPSGMLADCIGRKWTLLLTGCISLFGFLLMIFTREFWAVCVARVLSGFTLGASPTVAPVYMAEVSPPSVRGALSGQLITVFFIGQVIVYCSGHNLSYGSYLWVCTIVPFVYIASSVIVPESPYYLLKRGKKEEAIASMKKLRRNFDENEFEQISQNLNEGGDKGSWKVLFKWESFKILIVLQLLSFISHMNGLPTLSLYATETFNGQAWLTLAMGGILAVSSFIAAFLTDPIGRRPLLIFSLAGSAVFTAVLTAYFYVEIDALLYIGVIGFAVISSVGISPLIMTLQGELFPTSTRALASGITELTLSVASFICLYIYVPIDEHWGMSVNYIIYTVLSVVGMFVVIFFLPETSKTTISA